MRVTVTIDDDLYAKALELAEPGMEPSELLREAVETFVRLNTAKRLIALGGTAEDLDSIPRRKLEINDS